MRHTNAMLIGLFLCTLPATARAQLPSVAPEDFSHVVGDWFRIEASAAPTQLAVEDPLILTVRISSKQPTEHPPRRDKLRLFPEDLSGDFIIEDLPEKDTSAERSWVFHYRLKPRRVDVGSIPALRLVYYHPGRKKIQTALSEPVALTVQPRAAVSTPPEIAKALRAPPAVYEIVTGPGVLADTGPSWLLQPWLLLLLVLGPPAGCAMWYWTWRRSHPDAALEMKQRRHRSTQQALRELQGAEQAPQRLAAILMDYLRRRVDLHGAEPTPREVDEHLRRLGVSKKVRRDIGDVLRGCDAARFAGAEVAPAALAHAAVNLVHALEAEPCLGRPALAPRAAMLCLAVFVLPVLANASDSEPTIDPKAVLAHAESAFARGKATDDQVKARAEFASAAGLYAQLRGSNPSLHLNEGNAQLLAGCLPEAILAYQRGLRLAPNDGRLRDNLDYARQRIAFPGERGRPPASAWPSWLPQPGTDLLVGLAAVLYGLGCVALTFWLIVRPIGGLVRVGLLFVCAVAAACVVSVRLSEADDRARRPSIVVASEATFHRGNGESYTRHPDLPMLPPGLEGRRLHERGDWLQIQLASGEIGWVRREHVLVE